jgi:hypothetical protein
VNHRSTLAAAAFASGMMLAGCSQGAGPGAGSTMGDGGSLGQVTQATVHSATSGQNSDLYVLSENGRNGPYSAAVYSGGGVKYLRSVPVAVQLGALGWVGFAADGLGRLYVSNTTSKNAPLLNIYVNRGATLLRTLAQEHSFFGLSIDSNHNLYTSCAAERVCEYAKSTQHITRRLQRSTAPLAVDAAGDVAVRAYPQDIDVYAPGEKSPYWQIKGATYSIVALAFDSIGNLYTVDDSKTGVVSVYSPGATDPTLTLTDGINQPGAIAIDAENNIYVLNRNNSGHDFVTEYAQGGTQQIRTITDGVVGAQAGVIDFDGSPIAVDSTGNLYVANEGFPGNVTVYAPGASSPSRIITKGLYNPISVAL